MVTQRLKTLFEAYSVLRPRLGLRELVLFSTHMLLPLVWTGLRCGGMVASPGANAFSVYLPGNDRLSEELFQEKKKKSIFKSCKFATC